MKITVINGTGKRGVTYRLKEMFLTRFEPNSGTKEITEFYLPKDCPCFCSGCMRCCVEDESKCQDFEYVRHIAKAIMEADLIVMTSPAYAMHATGAMEALLDHFAPRWMPHRPAPEMFGKRAVIITQCLGVGAKQAAKDIKRSLSWWGISDIRVFTGALMENIVWDGLSEKRKNKLTAKIERLSKRTSRINFDKPAHTSIATKLKFTVCRFIQKKLYKKNADYADAAYWHSRGWLGRSRPWKPRSK